jgi:copper(I)-binding protein
VVRLLTLLGLVAAVEGCRGTAERPAALAVVDAYAAEPATSETGAVYFRVVNPLDTPDTLLGATSPVAASAEVHAQVQTGGMVHMRAAGPLEVPARGTLQLKPGDLHLMLMMLHTMPRAGDTIDVTLRFRRAGVIAVRVPVLSYAQVGERAAAEGRAAR